MSILCDTQIRELVGIEPFEENVKRPGRVSYGVSSYGYDVRVGPIFKIFTNASPTGGQTVVDPKAFGEDMFVTVDTDKTGRDHVIIPPNSFALAATVEVMRIPRDVLAVCLGKCVTGDTRVVDAETGEYLPIREFAGRGRTVGLDGWRAATPAVADFVPQGRQKVYELRTRAGLRIKATPNHPFRQFEGWTPMWQLRPGDRIAAAREVPVFGRTPLAEWEAALLGLMISEGQCRTPGHSPVFTSEDPVLIDLLRRSVREGLDCEVTHNGNLGYRLVNHAGRGGIPKRNRATVWLEGHGMAVGAAKKFVPQAIFKAPAEGARHFLQALFAGDGSVQSQKHKGEEGPRVEYYSNSRRLVEDVHHLLLRFGIISLIRSKITAIGTTAHRVQITDRQEVLRFAERVGFWPGSKKQVRLESLTPGLLARGRGRSNFDTLPPEAWGLLRVASRGAGRSLASVGIRPTLSQSVPLTFARQAGTLLGHAKLAELADHGPLWDVVESIEAVGYEETYDLTVPDAHNFLANGLYIHNSTYARCGLIVNVTPLEPEWEGKVTLEISNTTPLPAKVYANEGIAQMLFFKADRVCETSYADKGGKYQHQAGLTLPRVD